MACDLCRNTGYIVLTHSAICDGAFVPEYETVNCDCNPPATDDDAPDWEPYVEWEDTHRFNDYQYAGL